MIRNRFQSLIFHIRWWKIRFLLRSEFDLQSGWRVLMVELLDWRIEWWWVLFGVWDLRQISLYCEDLLAVSPNMIITVINHVRSIISHLNHIRNYFDCQINVTLITSPETQPFSDHMTHMMMFCNVPRSPLSSTPGSQFSCLHHTCDNVTMTSYCRTSEQIAKINR